MSESKVTNLIGMKIIGQHGRDIGFVADMSADVETWQCRPWKSSSTPQHWTS